MQTLRQGATLLLGLVSTFFALFEWIHFFEPPARQAEWISIIIAVVLPLLLAKWLCRDFPTWRILALSSTSLALLAALAMILRPESTDFVPCTPFSFLWDDWRGAHTFSWSHILAAQLLVLVVGLCAGFWPGRRDLLKPFAQLFVAQSLAALLVADVAFLGYPTRAVTKTAVTGQKDFDAYLKATLDSWNDAHPQELALTFQLVRSRLPILLAVSIHRGSSWQLSSLRARYQHSEDRFRIETIQRELTDAEAHHLFTQMESLGLWQMEQSLLSTSGLDGSSWIFKGHNQGKELNLDAWSPGYRPSYHSSQTRAALSNVERAGRLMLSESGFAVCERWLF